MRDPSLRSLCTLFYVMHEANLTLIFMQVHIVTPPHEVHNEDFYMNLAEDFTRSGKVSFCRKRLLAYKHGNFMANSI